MPNLYPTTTRLAILDDVDHGCILRGISGGSFHRRTYRTLSSRAAEPSGARTWQLTDAGRAVLARRWTTRITCS